MGSRRQMMAPRGRRERRGRQRARSRHSSSKTSQRRETVLRPSESLGWGATAVSSRHYVNRLMTTMVRTRRKMWTRHHPNLSPSSCNWAAAARSSRLRGLQLKAGPRPKTTAHRPGPTRLRLTPASGSSLTSQGEQSDTTQSSEKGSTSQGSPPRAAAAQGPGRLFSVYLFTFRVTVFGVEFFF